MILLEEKLVISRVIIRVTPFRFTYNSIYKLLTKSPAPSGSHQTGLPQKGSIGKHQTLLGLLILLISVSISILIVSAIVLCISSIIIIIHIVILIRSRIGKASREVPILIRRCFTKSCCPS